MAGRWRHELLALAVEEGIGADEKRVGLELHQSAESGIDFALGAGLQNLQLHGLRARRFSHPSDDPFGLHIVWVHQHCDDAGLRNHLRKQLETLGCQFGHHHSDAGQVAARSRETRDEAALDRVPTADEDDRNRGGRVLCRSSRSDCVCCDQVDVACNEVGGQGGQLIKPALRPAIFDRNALSVHEAGFTQSLAESGHTRRRKVRCETAEKSDHRHRLLLRAQCAWDGHSAGQREQQFTTVHSMTSSAVTRGRPVRSSFRVPDAVWHSLIPVETRASSATKPSDTSATDADRRTAVPVLRKSLEICQEILTGWRSPCPRSPSANGERILPFDSL